METYLLFMRDKNDKEFIFDHRHYKFYNYDEYSSLNPRSYVVSNKSIDDLILSFSCSTQGINIYNNLTPFSKIWIETIQSPITSYNMDISDSIIDRISKIWADTSSDIQFIITSYGVEIIKQILKLSNGRTIRYIFFGELEQLYIDMFKIKEYDYANYHPYTNIILIYDDNKDIGNYFKLTFDNDMFI